MLSASEEAQAESRRRPWTTDDVLLVGIVGTAAASPFPGAGEVLVGLSALGLFSAPAVPGRRRLPWLPFPFLAWAGLSIVWSDARALTLRQVVIFGLLAVAVPLLVDRLGSWRTIRAVALAMKLVLSLSVALYVGAPAAGRTQGAYQSGAFEGVFEQRNTAAFFAVSAAALFLAFSFAPRPRPAGSWLPAWVALAAVVVVLTSSGTGVAVLALAVSVIVTLAAVKRAGVPGRLRWAALVLAGCALLMWWLVHNLASASGLVGRDATLTGRTVIWEAVIPAIQDSPWQGYGFNALWVSGVPITERMWAAGGFRFYHAHNAYLDALLQLGIVGLFLVLVLLVGLLVASVRLYARTASGYGIWAITVVITTVVYGLPELSFLSHAGWVVLLVTAAVVGHRSAQQPEDRRDLAGARPDEADGS